MEEEVQICARRKGPHLPAISRGLLSSLSSRQISTLRPRPDGVADAGVQTLPALRERLRDRIIFFHIRSFTSLRIQVAVMTEPVVAPGKKGKVSD